MTQDADVVIDINGFFGPALGAGLSLRATPPCRVIDTRMPAGSAARTGQMNVPVSGSPCATPIEAKAYVFNATVIPPGALGYLTLWQGSPAAMPLASTLNASDGMVTSNMAIVPAGLGEISAFLSNASHLVLDTFGYFAP